MRAGDRRGQGRRRQGRRHAGACLSRRCSARTASRTGFAASNVVTATTDVDRAGALIDAAVEAGANQVNGPGLSVADQGALYRKALDGGDGGCAAQRRDARRCGRALAREGDVGRRGRRATPMPMAEKAAAMDAGTPVEAGVQQVTASVTVTFALG